MGSITTKITKANERCRAGKVPPSYGGLAKGTCAYALHQGRGHGLATENPVQPGRNAKNWKRKQISRGAGAVTLRQYKGISAEKLMRREKKPKELILRGRKKKNKLVTGVFKKEFRPSFSSSKKSGKEPSKT